MERAVLGDYLILKPLGQGATGATYLGEHRLLKRRVVIKVLPEELTQDPTFLSRFEEQIALLAQLDHPNIFKIHNVASDKGKYFFVTDEIHHESSVNLSQFLTSKKEPLEEESLFNILNQLALALDYAHHEAVDGVPVAHLGLKLNNVIVRRSDDQTTVLLSDFGLSKIVGLKAILSLTYKFVTEAIGLSNPYVPNEKVGFLHNSFLQTLHFLAPEDKRAETSNYKSDVYAFGVLVYYALTGQFPEGSFQNPSHFVPNFRFDWDRVITSCLNPKQEERPTHLAQLMKGIKREQKKTYFEQYAAIKIEEPVLASVGADVRAPQPLIRAQAIERPSYEIDVKNPSEFETVVKQYQQERRVVNTEPLNSEMVVIQGGAYMQGSNEGHRDEMPLHQIQLDAFAMDVHPVTNEQFVRFLEAMGGEKDRNHQDIIRLKDSRIKRSAGRLVIESGYTKHPVVGVTWYGALAYAKWVGKRLPTESEWEIASRGGNESAIFPTGLNIEKSMANFFSSDTTPVCSYPPNDYGLYDMAGNVYEWCHDWYAYNYYEISLQEPINPKGPQQGVYRVLRGGCWKSLKEDLSCSRRHRNNPGALNGTYGFRCVADVQ